jgi:glycolate oxidase FAD binding subunit
VRALPEAKATVAGDYRRASEAAAAYRDVLRAPAAPEMAALLNPTRAGSDRWRLMLRYEGLREEAEEGAAEARRRIGPRAVAEASDEEWEAIADFPAVPAAETTLVLRGQAVPARSFDLAELWRDGGPLVALPDSGLVYSHTEDPEALADRLEQAGRLGAHVVLERAPAAIKQDRDVFGELPAGFELMRAIKDKLDPRGILSPGRFVGRI